MNAFRFFSRLTPSLTRITFNLLTLWLTSTAVQAQTGAAAPTPVEIDLSKPNGMAIFDDAFYQNQLFLLGESHGVQKPQELDFALLKHLNERVGVRYYIAEVDPSKAYFINQYLQTGNDSTLMKVFRSWVNNKEQWANRDFYRKIGRIRALNQTLPAERRIRFVGIDRIQERKLVAEHLIELLAGRRLSPTARPLADTLLNRLQTLRPDSLRAEAATAWLNDLNANPNTYRQLPADRLSELKHVLSNVVYLKTLKREPTIFANFKTFVENTDLKNEKLYGFWGFFHVLQAPTANRSKPFAALVRESNLPMHDKIASITCLYVDCQMMLASAYLPPMWQTPGKTFSRVDQFNNNGPMMRTEGIEQLMALSRPNTLTLFKMTGTDAGQRPGRITYSPFMPKEQQFNFEENRPMTDYFGYTILVRNSDMTEPLVP